MIGVAAYQGYKMVTESTGGLDINWPVFWYVVICSALLIVSILSAGDSNGN